MSLPHAVLGLLIEQPGDDADVTRRLAHRIAGWAPTRLAVLETLAALRRDDLVRTGRHDDSGSGARTGARYVPTVRGSRAFDAWVVAAPAHLLPLDEIKVRYALVKPQHELGLQ